ncbi:SDR family NAD(P)-dependent oxidoreductase [Nocardioides iriomotensis]|uniref:SDR family NAD(P)-dependent oxidoreductase n=1 Tax=Nocardioides iriomotensis TaxID=715784 RepID=A0A4Q5J9I8_9ACTN|nr:SDR family NAD(P)-dependent oxidoreductase [Nocardioides iriomotensis]RYU15273.1 SDR family NAD(P)-dependent oxidoreductase [Nocardioides iriomotensis]
MSALTRALDTALDRTVVPGYSSIGYRLRRTWWPDDPRPEALAGKVALVTGAGSGLGQATGLGLARLGATVHLLVRDEAKGAAAADAIRAEVPQAEVHVRLCDVSDLSAVRRFAEAFAREVPRLDVLVHNAGTLPAERTESVDGHELTVAVHVLGPVLMTELLRPVLAGHDARVVLVASGGMYAQRLPADDPDYRRGEYRGTTAYARSKRMQVALAPLLQERWRSDGIAVHVMHPGWAATPGVTSSLPTFAKVTGPVLRDASAGADTVVWLAASEPAPPGGRFWHDRAPRTTHYRRGTRETAQERDQVWRWVLDAVGLD